MSGLTGSEGNIMSHRQLFSTSQMLENEQDQNWNTLHMEQSYTNLAGGVSTENGSCFYPVENMTVDGVHFASHWNPAPMSNGFISSHSGPSQDPFLHSSSAGTYFPVPENHGHHATSSNYERQTMHGIENGIVDLPMGNGRGPHKRKSPGIPSCERGSSSRYYEAGTSSEAPLSSELRWDKPNLDPPYWDRVTMTPSHQGNISNRAEGSVRNVRSRPALDLEPNLFRTHLSINPSQSSCYATHPVDHSSLVDFSGQSSSELTHDWSHARMSPAHGRMLMPDSSTFSHETNHFLVGINVANSSIDSREYHHDLSSSRNPGAPPNFHSSSTHSLRGIRSSHIQRSCPTFRASSSTLQLGHMAPSDDGLQLIAETYSSREPRSVPTISLRNSDRNGRSRVSYERCRALRNEAALHDRFSSEGFMVVDRSGFYGSRNVLDPHRDMRLDIDNMDYEELLALGERIGNVNTGLSEQMISKCLTETVYCSPDQIQEGGNCVICLEEYKHMDDVGSLKICGHDYHVSCIKKWLSLKNSCPICKASALPDNLKNE